jgi:hypothetical protein
MFYQKCLKETSVKLFLPGVVLVDYESSEIHGVQVPACYFSSYQRFETHCGRFIIALT